MVIKLVVIVLLLLIVGSLFSALTFLMNAKHDSEHMARALTLRVGLSVGLFLLLMASYYFGLIPQHGL